MNINSKQPDAYLTEKAFKYLDEAVNLFGEKAIEIQFLGVEFIPVSGFEAEGHPVD